MSPVPEPRANPAAIDREIEFDRVGTLYSIALPSLLGGVAYSALIGLMLWQLVPRALLSGWVAFKVLLLVIRLIDGRLFKRARHPALRMAHWKNRFFVATIQGMRAMARIKSDRKALESVAGVALAALE